MQCSLYVQAFSNYTEKTAIFAPMSQIWYIGDSDYRTQVTLSQDVDVHSNDWIGIFDVSISYFVSNIL